jgi:proton-dependent oligopeptide transporter, POT family
LENTIGATAVPETGKSVLGHPRGLLVLFVAEMWERFSYYGMRALLVLYLTWHFLFEREFALTLYGAYVALVYLGPLLGGYLADRFIGFRRAVFFGAILLVIGHGLMGLHGLPASESLRVGDQTYVFERATYDEAEKRNIIVDGAAVPVLTFQQPEKGSTTRTVTFERNGQTETLQGEIVRERSPFHEQILFLALSLIVAGVGFLKANISACVGALYQEGDRRRDAGFTIYYMGINLGAFAASLVCAWLAASYGWAYGFGAAAVGMLLGLIVFAIGKPWLDGKAEEPAGVDLKKPVFAGLNTETLVYLSGILMIAAAYGLLQIASLMSTAMHGVFAISSLALLIYMITKLERVERDRMIGLLILIVSSILFWTLFDQGPSSLNLFAAAHVDNSIGGWQFPAPVLQSANPLFIIIFAIPVALLWTWLGKRNSEPNAFVKFAFALVQIGAGFFVLNLGITLAGTDEAGNVGKVSVIFVLLMYLLHTTGELFLSPVGLSSVSKLSIKTLVGFMMGYWFFATSYANIIAAEVAKATQVPEGAPAAESIAAYQNVFAILGATSVGIGILLFLASFALRKLLHGVR